MRVAVAQRLEAEALLDQLQDRRGVVGRAIDRALLGERRDHDRWDPRAWTPAVDARRRDVIPGAAVLVVGHDDDGRCPRGTLSDSFHDVRRFAVACDDTGVPRMLVIAAERLPECHRGQRIGVDRLQKFTLVLEMPGAARRTGTIFGEIRERLMMIFEGAVGMAAHRIGPAARVPGPVDSLLGQSVADRVVRLCRQ